MKIQDAYNIIGDLTPLKNADCGKLCNKICCEGDSAGMLLFPGEEIIFSEPKMQEKGFYIEEIEYMDTPDIKLLVCGGSCERNMRPFACRIFPVAPNVGKNGKVTVQPDIRAKRMCPLWNLKNIDINFINAVEKAFDFLSENQDALSLMRLISAELDELKRFFY